MFDVTGLINLCERMDKLQVTIGPYIKKFREEHKLTQIKMANALGITQVTLSKIENGHDKPSTKLTKNILEYMQNYGRVITTGS